MDPALRFLRRIVAIDSVNPSLVPGAAGEQAVSEAVAAELRAIGLDVECEDVRPGRPNVVGLLEGRRPGPALMLCGHLDTVGVAGMAAPFDPIERDGRLYGRGAQDMKGGVAAMVGAAGRLAESGGLAAGRLIVAGVVDEEFASLGAEALVARWRADAGIVTEPTDLMVGIGHKGFAWLEVEMRGQAAHGSRPLEGRDAILRMGRLLARLETLDHALQTRPPHPLLGTASLHAATIEGGRELSIYPDTCRLRLERRTLPGEPEGIALQEVERLLAELRSADPTLEAHAKPLLERFPHVIAADHALPQALMRVLGARRRADLAGLSFWTDATVLGQAGIPTVIFGPGGAGLHGHEEYVRLDDVVTCRDVLVDLARAFCGA